MRRLHLLSLCSLGLLLGACTLQKVSEPIDSNPNPNQRQLAQTYNKTLAALKSLRFRPDLVGMPCLNVAATCDPEHPDVSLFGPGLATQGEILTALRAAGFDTATSEIHVIGPPTFPPAGALPWPLSGAVVPPGSVQSGSRLTVQVRLWKLTLQRLTVFSGSATIDGLVLDSQGQPATWLGRSFFTKQGLVSTLPALGSASIYESLPLTQFNPAFPLAPGHYTLRVHLHQLHLHLDPLLWIPGESKHRGDVTLSDVPFEIVP
ncbi:hypothetical protein MF271_05720 [Deinococcus sp. KNUC1210]|uniref:hypothetical protein n=1 Tax=Deinococcus sp. KNUC1210 TaxID=2917691 RepID=UPI001EEFBB34|nr:hypothetical protein [Deinococcus sp. KNUC1210]ULH16119.1 hypothetical protein MF271_05720 [Deinococcus sp. KNUC1210]